jgi:hypothetical protein
MASRKTYFGIGWKDPTDPEQGAPNKSDPEDRSAPTVVDDERVAEGLRQLRSWYQGDAQRDPSPAAEQSRPTPPSSQPSKQAASQARPTAVGHATGPAPEATQRPIAPDPMRATMYGHDVHQFDLDALAAGNAEAQPPAPAPAPAPAPPSTALVVADPAVRQREALRQQAEAVPVATTGTQSDSFPLAQYGLGEAQRLHRPGHRSASYAAPVRQAPRVSIGSRVVLGIGIAALGTAFVLFIQSQSGSSPESAPVETSPSPAAPFRATSIPIPTTAPTPTPTPAPVVPARSTTSPSPRPLGSSPAATPASTAVPLVGEPKTQRPAPAITKASRRHKETKPDSTLPTEVDGTSIAAPAGEKETPEVKARSGATETQEPKETKEPGEAKEPKAAKEPKEAKPPSKEPKARPGDPDAPLPPSAD